MVQKKAFNLFKNPPFFISPRLAKEFKQRSLLFCALSIKYISLLGNIWPTVTSSSKEIKQKTLLFGSLSIKLIFLLMSEEDQRLTLRFRELLEKNC